MKKFFKALGAALIVGFCGGYVAYAHTIPGWDKPFNIELYYGFHFKISKISFCSSCNCKTISSKVAANFSIALLE